MGAIYTKGRLTFLGVYEKYRHELSQRLKWNPETQREYDSSYRNIIVPNIPRHDKTPMASLNREDFDKALDAIRKQGYEKESSLTDYKKGTLEKFLYLMRVVVEIGADHYECENCFADDHDAKIGKRKASSAKRIIPRSMTVEQEKLAGQDLLTDLMQPGEKMGLAAMLCLGVRNSEACGLNFGDFQPLKGHPDCLTALIYKTTKIDTNDPQAGGKTSNAERVILVPEAFAQLVLERKKQLEVLLGENVDHLPLVCRENNYHTRCSADDLTIAARALFHRIGISHRQMQAVRDEMKRSIEMGENNDDLKLDATAYFLRRVFATSLSIVGLSEAEISYEIGHHIDDPMQSRNEFLAGEKLYIIRQKMAQRVIVNTAYKEQKTNVLTLNQSVSLEGSGHLRFQVPKGATGVTLTISGKEPLDTITTEIQTNAEGEMMRVLCSSGLLTAEDYPRHLDILQDYHKNFYKN